MLTGAPGPTPALYSFYPMLLAMNLNTGPSWPHLDLNSGFTVDEGKPGPRFPRAALATFSGQSLQLNIPVLSISLSLVLSLEQKGARGCF